MSATLKSLVHKLAGVAILAATLLVPSTPAGAGSYFVDQCMPVLVPGLLEARFETASSQFTATQGCSLNDPGLQVDYASGEGETGAAQGSSGTWVWQAPPGTFITGGTAFSRLAGGGGLSGYLAVFADSGEGLVTEDGSDDQLRLSGIPPGQWRRFAARLECVQPVSGERCAAEAAAHAYVRQLTLQLTDVAAPRLSLAGPLLDQGLRRGPQMLTVGAADHGSGVQRVRIEVNGVPAGGDDLSTECNQPPDGPYRLSPCPPSFAKDHLLDTAAAPFQNGANTVEVCALDYAEREAANADCESHRIEVDNLCPGSPLGGGTRISAGFWPNGEKRITSAYGRHSLIRGRVFDASGSRLGGAQVCVLERTGSPEEGGFRLLGTTLSDVDGLWSYELGRGPSRRIKVAYRDRTDQVSRGLRLRVRSTATLRASRLLARTGQRLYFWGHIPGPRAEKRVVFLRGTVPGARRKFLIRRARTDAFGRFRFAYAFSPVGAPTRFVLSVLVPRQSGYPYLRGHSPHIFLRVSP